ncbi:MAG TPA: hypothetical protein VEP49_00050 [Acidimicrobiia bacterium]|nr:hypothetical protein [Acidimicrobiia bacterium]
MSVATNEPYEPPCIEDRAEIGRAFGEAPIGSTPAVSAVFRNDPQQPE